MGTFYPLIVKATTGKAAVGPYAVAFLFCIGAVLCALPLNYYFMRKPLTGAAPVTLRQFFATKPAHHLWGVVGGLIWCTGTTFNFVASHAQLVGAGHFLCAGAGRDDGFRHLGRLHLEGVRQCSRRVTPVLSR